MKNHILFACIFSVLLSACTEQTKRIEIADGISLQIPEKKDIEISDPNDIPRSWEAKFEDDVLKVFTYQIRFNDSADYQTKKLFFRKNVDSFLGTIDHRNLDSIYSRSENILQNDLVFDFEQNGNEYKVFVKFVCTQQDFIAFLYNTPFPVDYFSKKNKDKLFNGIEINR